MKQAGRNKATASIPSHSDEEDTETGVDKYFEALKKKQHAHICRTLIWNHPYCIFYKLQT